MKYYLINYKYSDRGEYIYPICVKDIVWAKVYYHFKENIMIGETEQDIADDVEPVTKLTKKDAITKIKEFEKSFPEPIADDPGLDPGVIDT